MATVLLPISTMRGDEGRLHFKFRHELEGVFYRFGYHYNGHFDSWFLDLFDDADEPLVAGQRAKLTTDALAQFKHLAVPPGTLQVVDTHDQHQEPTKDNFGTRTIVQYVEAS